ncbi:MAG TPA: DJ-1/PfpI family protein [Armatimonadota bacterium]
MTVQIAVFDGFDELDAIAPYEVLANARMAVSLVSEDGAEAVTAAHGLAVRPQGRLGEGDRPDILVVPGGGWAAGSASGVRGAIARGTLPETVRRMHAEGTVIAAVCTGAMALAAAGLTSGRPATTHRSALADLRAAGAAITDARVVDDGDIVTAGGVTSGLDLALWLVERFLGAGAAEAVAAGMEYARQGTVWRSW